MRGYDLTLLPGEFAISRLDAGAAIPDWALLGVPATVTRTADELSIVCRREHVPTGVCTRAGWRCLMVRGPLDFGLTGVLAGLATPLAAAGISVFAISTYDTDYLLVPMDSLEAAVAALLKAGHRLARDQAAGT